MLIFSLLAETKFFSKSGVKIEGVWVFPVVRKKNCGGGLIIVIRHGLCSSMIIDFGDINDITDVNNIVGNKRLRNIILVVLKSYKIRFVYQGCNPVQILSVLTSQWMS